MPIKRPLQLFSAIAGAMLVGTSAVAAPAMSTIWAETSLDLAGCVRQAETALQDAGLTHNTQTLHESVYGEYGMYTASIRCLSGKGVVFIVVSGPRQDRASQFVGVLKNKF
jgi:hypothetical protein